MILQRYSLSLLFAQYPSFCFSFAFVLFKNVEDADLAVEKVNNKELRFFDGLYRLKVTKSIDHRRIFLGRIPKQLNKQQVPIVFRLFKPTTRMTFEYY